jgi:hypothetical protein
VRLDDRQDGICDVHHSYRISPIVVVLQSPGYAYLYVAAYSLRHSLGARAHQSRLIFLRGALGGAPKTCAKFESLLPYRERIIHVRWSGEACWIPLGTLDLGLPYENQTSYPAPGEILLHPGGLSETEILIAYGGVHFGSKVGQLAGNHFLTITEGRERLRALGEHVLWHGAQDIVFESF